MSQPVGMPDADAVRDVWQAKAEAWVSTAEVIAASADRFNAPLLDVADLHPGQTVLDLASGAGEPALSEAERVGPEGCVVATDLVPDMLSGLKRRDQGDRLHYAGADMHRLPFAENSFDRVVCRFGIMFPPDPVAVASEVMRVLKPGGATAFLVWGPLSDQTLFEAIAAGVEQVTGKAPDSHFHQIFRFAKPGSASAPFRQAGFSDVEEVAHHSTALAPFGKPFWRPPLQITFGHELEGAGPETLKALDQAIADAFEPVREAEGFRLSAHVRTIRARKAT